MIPLLLLLTLGALSAPGLPSDDPLSIGEQLSGRSLARDLRGSRRSYDELRGEEGSVLVFLGIECPLANLYLPRVNELGARYHPQGIRFVAVYSGENETAPRVASHADDHDVPFLVVKDYGQRLADRVGVERTPAVVVLDGDGVLRYRGRIDDQYAIAARKPEPERNDLALALDALLADEPLLVTETDADGCLIERTPLDPGLGEVTYTRDVAPIVQEHCQACHRPGQIGPFSLVTYEDVARRSRMLGEVVEQRRMPPWHADERYGHFANDRSLSDDEIAVVRAWVAQGAPRGDAADLPPAPQWADAWNISEPDLVLSVPEPIPVPAEGVLDYHYVVTDTDFEHDVWVQEVEIRPGNARVLHHVLVYIQPPGTSGGGFGRLSRALVNWVPGTVSKVNPAGTATRIPAGSTLLWELHYTPNGTATTDQTSLALAFADEPPERETTFTIFADFWIKVRAGASHHREEHVMKFAKEVRLVSLRPHMHLRGKSWRYEAIFPDGRTETLLNVPNWDFNWQTEYFFSEPILLPGGTKLRSTAHFDNSTDNLANPDPTKDVRYGRQTFEEMMNGWVKYDVPLRSTEPSDDG